MKLNKKKKILINKSVELCWSFKEGFNLWMNNDSNNLRSNLSQEAKILKFSRVIGWFVAREWSKMLLFSGVVRGLLVLKEQLLCWDTLTFSCFEVWPT